jgi:acyl-CoA dehydrogenase
MFLVPSDTPGLRVLCNIGLGDEGFGEGMHAHVRYENVRIPAENLLGDKGEGFAVAQRRLGGGRIHHAMRSVAAAQKAFDMMCERSLSRFTQGSVLAEKQMVQDMIAESWMQIQEFRLLVMYTAWLIDQSSTAQVRQYVSACKVRAAEVLHDVGTRTQHIHGALGVSNLMAQSSSGSTMGLVDGVTEIHKVSIARRVLKSYQPSPDMWPTQFRPRVLVNARRRFETMLGQRIPDAATRRDFGQLIEDSPGRDEDIKAMEAYLDATIGNL